MNDIPTALVEPAPRRISAMWLVPVVALSILLGVVIVAWKGRGIDVKVEFVQGHGLTAGDAVRLRDIQIGVVGSLRLSPTGDRVLAILHIDRAFERFMRSGSSFWIQRPQLDFGGARGLETLVGSRFVGVRPGEGPPGRTFVGLRMPPPMEPPVPGDLELVVFASDRMGMRQGGVVTYRGMVAGRLRSVDLSSDARGVVARVLINARYAPLVRTNTRFFATSGVALGLSLEGLKVDIESLESLVAGGIAFATPTALETRAAPGHRFQLASEPKDSWLEWSPRMARGELGIGVLTPPPAHRGTLRWETSVLRIARSRQGWVLPTDEGTIIATRLMSPPSAARATEFVVDGTVYELDSLKGTKVSDDLVFVDLPLLNDAHGVAAANIEAIKEPELLLVWTSGEPIPVDAHLLSKASEGGFLIDPSVAFAEDDLGAPVSSAERGMLVGVLIVDGDGRGKVAFVSASSR